MAVWRKRLQFINVMLANRSPMSMADRGPGRMTYAKKIKPFAEHDLGIALQRAGNNLTGMFLLVSCSNIFPNLLWLVQGQGQKR